MLSQGPVTPALAHLFTDSRGFGWLSEDDFVNHFAGDVDPTRARVMYAVQQALASSAFTDVMAAPAWKSLPSWYLVAQNDEAIPPDAERMFASRMGATTVEIPSSHVAMVSHPARGRRTDREGGRSGRSGRRPLTSHERECLRWQPQKRHSAYADASTRRVTADNAIEYAYRELGDGDVPLVLLQHFRGNLDNWDPALIDALAADRRVVTFDNVGVGATTGRTPNTVEAMAHDAIAFLEAMELQAGRSARLLDRQLRRAGDRAHPPRPAAARRARVLRTAGRGGDARLGAGGDRRGRCAGDEPAGIPLRLLRSDGHESRSRPASRRAHLRGRTTDRDEPTTWQTRQAQYDAVCAWGIPNHSLLQRVAAIDLPVFVANGDSDPMILPRYSYLLAGLLPDARLTIYPDSAHGFLFQHHSQFAADVHAFLEEAV